MNVIEIRNLTKSYGKARGIIDVSFDVAEGEIFGFIGPNGAGKSTTIRTLLNLIHATSGSATVFGKDCRTHAPEIAREVGYLPSEVSYYDRMKVLDLLKYSASFYGKDCTKRIHELAAYMDLDLKRRIDDLSFGNKKKVGILQGLIHEPKLIILDEPTSGLDPLMQQRFFELLRQENAKGATILLSSHVLDEVQRLCGRVAIIKEGRIIRIESMGDLARDHYKKVGVEVGPEADAAFAALEGVTNLERKDGVVSFYYKGDINAVVAHLAGLRIRNLWVEEPTLEEIFLHYYQKEG